MVNFVGDSGRNILFYVITECHSVVLRVVKVQFVVNWLQMVLVQEKQLLDLRIIKEEFLENLDWIQGAPQLVS